jgi:hypothetical protein
MQFELDFPGVGKNPTVDLDREKMLRIIAKLLEGEILKLKHWKFPKPSAKTIERKRESNRTAPDRGMYDTGRLIDGMHVAYRPGVGVVVECEYYGKFHRSFMGALRGAAIRAIKRYMHLQNVRSK